MKAVAIMLALVLAADQPQEQATKNKSMRKCRHCYKRYKEILEEEVKQDNAHPLRP